MSHHGRAQLVKIKIFLMILIMVTPIAVFSQDEPQQPVFSNPVSPKAFEFLKYGEIPVSHYSGTPNISIPIYMIEAKGLNLPITISYHANGTRVLEESSWVGLGWTLNSGPTLTQVVNGFDDFETSLRPNDLELETLITEFTSFSPSSFLSGCNSKPSFSIQRDLNFGGVPYSYFHFEPDVMFGRKDTEPDIFKFNILGYSGDIVMDWSTGSFFCLNDPKINVISGSANEFRIQTPEGHLFHFSHVEVTDYENYDQFPTYEGQITPLGPYGNLVVSRNYNIDYIITNKGETINFDYHSSLVTKNIPTKNETITINKNISCIRDGGSWTGPPPGSVNLDTEYSTTNIQTKQNQFYLKEISWSNGKIEFTSSLDRVDFNNSRRLTDLTIYSKNNNNSVKSFHFENNDYFVGDDDSDVIVFPFLGKNMNELTKRLKLNKIIESKEPLMLYTDEPFYSFDYYNFSGFPQKNCTPNELGLVNSVSPELVRAGLLKSIDYPTKGKTSFTYEPHEYDNYSGSNDSYDIYGEEQFLRVETYGNTGSSNETLNFANINSNNQRYSYSAILSVLADGPCASSAFNSSTNLYNVIARVRKNKYNPVTGYYNITVFDEILQASSASPDAQYMIQGILEPDEYLFISTSLAVANGCQTNSNLPHCYADVLINYRTIENFQAIRNSGLRIKTINSYDVNDDLELSKEYRYSEGKIMSPLIKEIKELKDGFYVSGPYNSNGIGAGYECQYDKITKMSSTYYPISTSASGKHIGYDWVEEIQKGTTSLQEDGRMKYSFVNTPDLGVIEDNSGSYINHYYRKLFPLEKSYPQNGSILKVEVFNKNNTLLKETENTYVNSSIYNKCVYARKSTYRDGFRESAYTNNVGHVYMVGFYPITSRNTLLSSVTKKNYSQSGILLTNSVYIYDSKQQIKEKNSSNSNGDIISTKYKYPYDILGQYPYNYMTDFNFLSPIVEIETLINSEQVSYSRFNYSSLTVNSFGIYPLLTYSKSKGINDPLEELANYTYYEDGNIKEESRGNGKKNTYYIWGYNGQYPIARIENFTSDQAVAINNLIGDAIDAADTDHNAAQGNSTTENNLRAGLNAIRNHNALAGAQMVSYTYDPLIGVTSITDPKGRTNYYEYDEFNRLKHVKDEKGHILSETEYNYATQN